jgi:uncharacterized sulfatase
MISWPGHVTPGKREQLASTIDFAPTVLRACGIASEQSMPGLDLVALAASKDAERRTVFGEIFAHDVADVDDPSRSLLFRWFISDRWKLIVPTASKAKTQLYDVLRDPTEQRNLAAEQPERVAVMREALDRWWSPN